MTGSTIRTAQSADRGDGRPQERAGPQPVRAPLRRPREERQDFFNGIWEEDHQNQRVAMNSLVFTPSALAGHFRYSPARPTQRRGRYPHRDHFRPSPSARDSHRWAANRECFRQDPTARAPTQPEPLPNILCLVPPPNNYLVGDGLNTAGFIGRVPVIDDFQFFEGRIDHNFNDKHRLYITLNHQAYTSTNVANAQPFPGSPIGLAPTETTQYSVHYTDAIRANLLNEVRSACSARA